MKHELIRSHPLGLLISNGQAGLVANPVPFLVYPEGGPLGTLRCHVSRANSQWRDLLECEECLVTFQGPQAYISPSWYAAKLESGKVVPTWNYATVHAWGRPEVSDDAGWLRRQIGDLTDANEGRLPGPWRVDDAPEAFVASQVKGIVGIQIEIARLEGKWKLNQNRPVADCNGVVEGLRSLGGDDNIAVAALVERSAHES